jgi:hypothetical protein
MVSIIYQANYTFLILFAVLLFSAAFLFNTPGEILDGSLIILKSPANLVTDYFKIANIGAALANASAMILKSIAILRINRVQLNGAFVAAIFTIAGFSLFGKNFYNSLPIIFGVYIYSRLFHHPFKKHLLPSLFGTALGPIVSEISFNLSLPLHISIPLGILTGLLIGIILPPLAAHFKSFHKGYNLYNIGFTAGLIGTFVIAVLRCFGIKIETVSLVSSGNNIPFTLILISFFIGMLIYGLYLNNWTMKGFNELLKQSGKAATDFVLLSGFGLTLINMALLGIISTLYVIMVGGELSGPVIGGILTVVGFGAYGKHVRNIIPIIIGVSIVGCFSFHDVSSTPILLAALFGTTLAPVSGAYGPLAGIIAGGFHVAMVLNISYMHAGMNLYNNGFSGGFVAAMLVPLFDDLKGLGRKHLQRT